MTFMKCAVHCYECTLVWDCHSIVRKKDRRAKNILLTRGKSSVKV